MTSNELKTKTLRHTEYYGMTDTRDRLYADSLKGKKFNNLMELITSENNIMLAYRNIKSNKGSSTPGVDGVTIKDIDKLSYEDFIMKIKKKFQNYNPRKVRRKDIKKPNGKTRPLGIPSMWDRIIQQCILQILEPICEAKFNKHSYGFRPNHSAENAIADCFVRITHGKLAYVVDIDIQGFFDAVNHTKLMQQIWTLGIRDKQLLVIIRKILKAPIVLQNGKTEYPTKGTPQGGILSPLLANINLNEFDWWIYNQWEGRECKELSFHYNAKGVRHKGQVYKKLRKVTKLKEMYIVRYADDLKIFCRTRNDAIKTYHAAKQWLEERLRLNISDEKSQITNLKKKGSDFLGFTLHMKPKKKKWTMNSHVSKKAIKRVHRNLKEQIVRIQKAKNNHIKLKEVSKYNSMVIGVHNYYKIASHVNVDFNDLHYSILKSMYNRLEGLEKTSPIKVRDKGIKPYIKTPMVRFILDQPMLPIGYVQTRKPMNKKREINPFTPEGRKKIHKDLSTVSPAELKWLREHPVINDRATPKFNDNRISRYVQQRGKDGITGRNLDLEHMHCHHIIPWEISKDDSYDNLILVDEDVHRLIHATKEGTIIEYLELLKFDEEQLEKLNKYRAKVGNEPVTHNA